MLEQAFSGGYGTGGTQDDGAQHLGHSVEVHGAVDAEEHRRADHPNLVHGVAQGAGHDVRAKVDDADLAAVVLTC